MKNYEVLKELSKEELTIALANISAKIAKDLVMDEYGHELEISNFTLAEIEQNIGNWLERESRKK